MPAPPQTEALDTAAEGRGALVVAKAAGGLVAFVGLTVLAGWAFDVPTLKSLHPTFVAMKANTAAAFLLGGGALLLRANARGRAVVERLARVCAAMVALIGFLTLVETLVGWNLRIQAHPLRRSLRR